jgi:hypothetical protein
MSNISKLAANGGLAKDDNTNDPDVIECISVNGIVIDLRDVSHSLRREYHMASCAVGRHDKARDQLRAVGERILAEQLPKLAIKYAPKVSGDHAVMAKMMGLKK